MEKDLEIAVSDNLLPEKLINRIVCETYNIQPGEEHKSCFSISESGNYENTDCKFDASKIGVRSSKVGCKVLSQL